MVFAFPGHRREFLGQSLAAGAAAAMPWLISPAAAGVAGTVAPSETIRLGVIGIGPRATYDLRSMSNLPDVRCVALADVQAARREAGKKLIEELFPDTQCDTYRDLRELLDRKDIDAVLVATGDRWHAPGSMLAMEAGKDVYSEKPCGITIAKCRQLAETAKRTGRVFQAGTQRRSVPNFRFAAEMARSGKLGKLQTLYASVYEPQLDNTWLPREQTPPKEVVDWNLWLGPAPWRPFNKAYVQGGWRGQFDFDSGAKLLDWGAHTLDLCQWAAAADDTMPVEYEPAQDKIICRYADGLTVILDFLKTPFGDRAPKFITALGTCPVRYVGDKGWIETGDEGGVELQPESLNSEIREELARVKGLDVTAHARDFFDCVKSRGKPVCNEDVMYHSHTACHAAAIAWILNRKLTFDPIKAEFPGDEEANLLRSRPERDPFAAA